MIKKILLSLLFLVVLLLLYFGYDYINMKSISFIIFCAGFILLVSTVDDIRKATQKSDTNIDLITILVAIVMIGLFIVFGFIFKSLG